MTATRESLPCAARKLCSASLNSRWMSSNETSPPRIVRPCRASPSPSARETAPTPEIAATPSAIQARKTPKPRSPPRKSRKAMRRTSGQREGGRGVAELVVGMGAGLLVGAKPQVVRHPAKFKSEYSSSHAATGQLCANQGLVAKTRQFSEYLENQ